MEKKDITLECPLPLTDYPLVIMGHGGGGRLMRNLVNRFFVGAFRNRYLEQLGDGAVFKMAGQRFAFTTDSYVVQPIFFPGGDIGTLAVNGTVNDLAMCGARPLYLSAGFILEEGFPLETLWQITLSIKKAAEEAGVKVVTGDTKVVEKGKGDGIFINTTGIGILKHNLNISPLKIRSGDKIVLSGDIGRHGIAIMAAREGLKFETTIESDCADLSRIVLKLIEKGVNIHCLRDLTRGGLGSALVEIAETAGIEMMIEESLIPVDDEVQGACEILGLEPMYIANEGRFILILPEREVETALACMRKSPASSNATLIGSVTERKEGRVIMKSKIGARRVIDMPSGEQLPRIC